MGRNAELFISYNGKDMTLVEWAEEYDVSYSTLYYRYQKGLRNEELFRKPQLKGNDKTKKLEEK